MYAFLIVVHVLVCLFLIAVILLQAGRGSGFSELAGGSQTQSILGTQTNVFMTRLTEICAVVFVLTSLSLGIMSAQRGKSLMEKGFLNDALKRTTKGIPPIRNTRIPEAPKSSQSAASVPAPIVATVAEPTKTPGNPQAEVKTVNTPEAAPAIAGGTVSVTQSAAEPKAAGTAQEKPKAS